jgi:hypothetical protein
MEDEDEMEEFIWKNPWVDTINEMEMSNGPS